MKETLNNLKKVYNYGKKYKKNLIIFTLISLITIVINTLYPILTAKEIVLLSSSSYKNLFYVSLISLSVSLLSRITKVILRKNTQIFFRGTTKNIQLECINEILKINLKEIEKTETGSFVERIGKDTDDMSRVFTRGMSYITSFLTNIGIYVAIYILNKIVFCVFLTFSIILIFLHIIKVKKMNIKEKEYIIQKEKINTNIFELIKGIKELKMLENKKTFTNKVDNNINILTLKQFSWRNIEIKYNYIIDTTTDIFKFLIIILFIILIKNNLLEATSALILYNYKTQVLKDLIDSVGNILEEIKKFNLSCQRVFSIIENKEFTKETFGNTNLKTLKGKIRFKDVYFNYNDKEIIKGMNFTIEPRKTFAIVGKSGVGKSTIFKLLCKFYNIKSGKILLDGKNINELDEKTIRSNITLINQTPYIFNMSIKDNFKIVKSDITEEEIHMSCKEACLEEFINDLPYKYDTIIGEGGTNLSGGELERLGIAKSLINKKSIILIDESTASLDNETERKIEKVIDNLRKEHTIIIIAHRLTTIKNVDQIMIMEDGKITDIGSHKELLKRNKFYKRLYKNKEKITK